MGTFQLLLQALDHEGRVEEADVVWEKLLTEYEDCTPRSMFACVLTMFERHNQPKRLLQVLLVFFMLLQGLLLFNRFDLFTIYS